MPEATRTTVHTVATKTDWTGAQDPWTDNAILRCNNITDRISPGSGKVTNFDFFYGRIQEPGQDSFTEVEAVDYTGRYVRVSAAQPSDGVMTPRFYGIFTGGSDIPGADAGLGVAQGNQTLIARGLEWVLEHTTIDGSYIEHEETPLRVGRTLPFNFRTGRGITDIGNRSTSKATSTTGTGLTSYVFSEAGEIWTAADILEYYLAWFVPEKFDMDSAGDLSNLVAFTGYVKPAKNVADGLDAIINHRRGHTWRIETDPDTEINTIVISPTFTGSIVVGDTTILGNSDEVEIDPADFQGPDNIITTRSDIKYDKITARGSQILLMGTYNIGSGALEKGWTDANETAYKAASEDERKSEVYNHVFRTYKVAPGRLLGGPHCDVDGTLSSESKILQIGKSFLRQLPLLVTDDDASAPAGYRSPLVIVDVNGTGRWLPVDKLSDFKAPARSMSVKILDGQPAFNIRATPNYMLGENHYTPGEKFHFKAVADYESIYATVAYYSDEVFRVTKTITADGFGGTLIIDEPEAECWYRLADTITDADGTFTQITEAGELRRDVERLEGIAAMAAGWYGKPRSAIQLTRNEDADFTYKPGQLITHINYFNPGPREVNALITQIVYDFDHQRTIIKTDFRELDFAGMGRAMSQGIARDIGPRGPVGAAGVEGPAGTFGGNIGDEIAEANEPAIPGFWAEITDSFADGANRWNYSFKELFKNTAGYGGWGDRAGGRTGTKDTATAARNTIEDMNTDTPGTELGCGVAVDSLDTGDWTFTLSPAANGLIVWITEVNKADVTEYWFSHDNGVDGVCD